MTSILRISGESLDVAEMLGSCPLAFDRSWRKGERRSAKGAVHTDSGANFLASAADLDQFDQQVQDAKVFLDQNMSAIKKLASFTGVQSAVLDFGVSPDDSSAFTFCRFSPELIRLVAEAGVGLEISYYASAAI